MIFLFKGVEFSLANSFSVFGTTPRLVTFFACCYSFESEKVVLA